MVITVVGVLYYKLCVWVYPSNYYKISDFEGNRPVNHQKSLKSRPGDNKGIKYHRWLY